MWLAGAVLPGDSVSQSVRLFVHCPPGRNSICRTQASHLSSHNETSSSGESFDGRKRRPVAPANMDKQDHAKRRAFWGNKHSMYARQMHTGRQGRQVSHLRSFDLDARVALWIHPSPCKACV